MRKFLVKTSQFPKQKAVMGISGLHQAITTMQPMGPSMRCKPDAGRRKRCA